MSVAFSPSNNPQIHASGPIPIPDDVLLEILKKLSLKELASFKQTCKAYSGNFTEKIFKVLQFKEFNFDWKMSTSYQEMYKQAYLLNLYVTKYQREIFRSGVYAGLGYALLCEHFPPFKIYYERDQRLREKKNFDDLNQETEGVLARYKDSFVGLLLNPLFEMQKYRLAKEENTKTLALKIVESCQMAIDVNVKCVAFYVFLQVEPTEKDYANFKGIFLYAARHGNSDIFKQFCEKFRNIASFQEQILEICDNIPQKGQLLFCLAKEAADFDLKEKILNRAIQAYGADNTPGEVWEIIGYIHVSKANFTEAEKCFTHAIHSYQNKVPPYIFETMVDMKMDLGNWLEAEHFLNRLPKPQKKDAFIRAIKVKVNLQKWSEAKDLFEHLQKSFPKGLDTSTELLFSYAKTLFELGFFDEAKHVISKLMRFYRVPINQMSPDEAGLVGEVFFSVKDYHQAEQYFDV